MVKKMLLRVAGTALAMAAFCCGAGVSLRPVVPERLDVEADQPLALLAHASGYQIYACMAGSEPSRFDWTLKAPEAELVDDDGHRIGRHYAGPTWEAEDGSKVVGAVEARVDAPTADAVPWLLLAAKSNSGSGVFAHVAHIQRIDTRGGRVGEDMPCDATRAGSEQRVPYAATYVFYDARS